MTLVIDRVYRVQCLLCDWVREYVDKDKIPETCPSCGGDKEAWTRKWELRKDEIHERIKPDGFKWGRA